MRQATCAGSADSEGRLELTWLQLTWLAHRLILPILCALQVSIDSCHTASTWL